MGAILLLLLVVGALVIGRTINRMAGQMSDRIVMQIGEYHYRILKVEFGRSEEVLTFATRFVREHPTPTLSELRVLTTTLMELDQKIGRIWFLEATKGSMLDFPRGGDPCHRSPEEDFRADLIAGIKSDSLLNEVTHFGPHATWTLACAFTASDGSRQICGVDFPLPEMYSHMAEQTPYSRSYATLFDAKGIIVIHPDSLKLGQQATDSTTTTALRQVATTGQQFMLSTLSDYLHVEEECIYYPISIGGSRWVAGISIPRFNIEQEMGDFHFYTILAAVISVLVFAVLLIFAQRRWRHEYELRRRSERESEQLQLQQVLEQIDPHFLFNSLNSLYALIHRNPEQAREFTLNLSRVYRHVLERRNEILTTLSDEIDFTWQYYSLQKIRFDDRIELSSSVDPALRNYRIPAMSLQTLVENAIKHNHITAKNPLHIRIRTEQGHLVIENNYTPRTDRNSDSLGVGLERIRSVYRFYTDENITIETEEGIFRCQLPLLPAEK